MTISLILPVAIISHGIPSARAQPAPKASSPQMAVAVTLKAFYGWYFKELTKERDPLHDDRSTIETYVSQTLLKQIDRRSKNDEVMPEDYFLKAQDYLDDWESNIAVSDVHVDGEVATAIVTLGATTESKHRLAVALVDEGGSWKIGNVRDPKGR